MKAGTQQHGENVDHLRESDVIRWVWIDCDSYLNNTVWRSNEKHCRTPSLLIPTSILKVSGTVALNCVLALLTQSIPDLGPVKPTDGFKTKGLRGQSAASGLISWFHLRQCSSTSGTRKNRPGKQTQTGHELLDGTKNRTK